MKNIVIYLLRQLNVNNSIRLFVTIFILFYFNTISCAQCNGFTELCSKKYDEVAYLTTHNAFNCSENNFSLPNQTYSITNQLNDGVRGLMIDVYDVGGTPTVYHGSSYLGHVPLISILNEINVFLIANPNEIVSIIFESYTSADAIAQVMIQAGLMSFLFEKNASSDWPTLQEMINNNKRLVVFSEKNDAGPNNKWYHYVWNYAVETEFSVNDTASFTCDFNRGNPSNDLFIFNHFVTNYLGVGSLAQAQIANANPFFINRVSECRQFHNKFPNFITVDFYETANCFDVVNELNGVVASTNEMTHFSETEINIWPNPVSNTLNIEYNTKISQLLISDVLGKVFIKQQVYNKAVSVDVSGLSKGLYFVKMEGMMGGIVKKFVME